MKQDRRQSEPDRQARNERRLYWAALLTAGFMVAEVVGGLLTGSLALIADAAHMLTDAVALGLAWIAFRLARQRGPSARLTYGLRRLPVLVAFGNGLALFFIVGWILVEAMDRLAAPIAVLAGPMLAVATAGLFVNIGSFAILHGADRGNLNIRGAILHVLGDLLGSVAAIAAAGIILSTGWYPADPLLSILVAAIVAVGAFRLTRDSAHILLEGAPEGVDIAAIGADLSRHVAGVDEIHHVHVWSLSEEGVMATLHARIAETADGDTVLAAIRDRLDAEFGIGHATIQIEREGC
jgi:cobalt-zinc-cadmium efflux system protein